jgi:hypothetical protein
MDKHVCHVLRARAELKDRKCFREGINRQPEPQRLGGATLAGTQLIQLEVGDLQAAEAALV